MKHPNILAAMIAPCVFYTPAPAYGEAGALEEPPPLNAPPVGPIDGDTQPDWGALDKLHGDDPKADIIAAPPNPGEKLAKDISQTPDPAPATPETPKAPPEPVKAPETPVTAPETPKVPEVKPLESGFDSAAELKRVEAMQISPKASETTKEGFRNVKEVTAKFAARCTELETKLADAEKRGGMTPELEAEVKSLREFKDTWGAEHDQEFLKPFTERIGKADDQFIKTLSERDIGLPKTDADARALNGSGLFADAEKTIPISEETMRRVGIDSAEGKQIVSRVLGILRAKEDDPLLYEKAMDGVRARNSILSERDAKIAEVREKQGGYSKAQEARVAAERTGYGQAADKKLIAMFQGSKWAERITAAADATPEAKANAEAHNKWIDSELIPKIHGYIGAIWGRDPEKGMEAVYKAVAHDQVAKERDALLAEKAQLEARVAELSKTAAGVRTVSAAPTKVSGPSATPVKEAPNLNQSSDDAIEAFRKERGI